MPERLVRASLWLSAPFNFVAAYAVCKPGSGLGQLFGLPSPVPAVYALILGFMIAAFGVVYAWLAASRAIDRPLLTLGAVGKAGVFLIVAALWLQGVVPVALLIVSCGDLAFALIWSRWLLGERRRLRPPGADPGRQEVVPPA